jgi:predicted GNAT family acetyltransferase
MTDRATVEVRDNPERQRFDAYVDEELAGFSTYERDDKGITIMHTEVDDAFEGRGVGSALVRQMLDQLRQDDGLRVTVLCPFVTHWMRKHPEYRDLLRR